MQEIAKNVFVDTSVRGCNHGFVVTSEGVVMIDTPHQPSDAIKWRDEIARHGPVRYVINSEPHVDHWTGNFFFDGAVVGHEGVRERILSDGRDYAMEMVRTMGPEQIALMEGYEPKPPSITYTEDLSLHVGEHEFVVLHHPGHTAYQSAILLVQEGIVFTSDNIFHEVQTWLQEALPDEWLNTLERLRKIDADVFVPGHGELCGKDYLDEQGEFIQDWVTLVKGAIDRGMTKQEAVEKLSLLDRYPMDIGIDYLGPQLMQWNVSRLWDVLTEASA